MTKVKTKKMHTGVKPIGGSVVKSRKLARKITSAFHKAMSTETTGIPATSDAADNLKTLSKEELFRLNGVNRYQEASIISTNHFKTSKWIIQALQRLNKLPDSKSGNLDGKLSTLEVGAINDKLFRSPYLSVRAVDINAQLPCIEECDFFDIVPQRQYDVVVCSMVINCVFDPKKRSEMLFRLLCHLKDNGFVFLILPSRCLSGDQISGQDSFVELLCCLGFELAEPPHNTPHLAFFILKSCSKFVDIASQSGSLDWSKWVNTFLRRMNSADQQTTILQRFSSSTANNVNPHKNQFTILIDEDLWLKQPKKRRRGAAS